MPRNQRDEAIGSAISDTSGPAACSALTATAGEWAAVSGSVITDLGTLSGSLAAHKTSVDNCVTAINSIILALETRGIIADE